MCFGMWSGTIFIILSDSLTNPVISLHQYGHIDLLQNNFSVKLKLVKELNLTPNKRQDLSCTYLVSKLNSVCIGTQKCQKAENAIFGKTLIFQNTEYMARLISGQQSPFNVCFWQLTYCQEK